MLSKQMQKQYKIWGTVVLIFYILCFGFLTTNSLQVWILAPFVESLISVFMAAGAIAVITGIILIFQSSIQSEQEKKKSVFDEKLTLYMKIIDDMNGYFKDGIIDEDEKRDLFFTLLKVEILSKPITFNGFVHLIQNITDENGNINEESRKNLVQFIKLAREDLDVQEKITDASEKKLLADALRNTESVGTKLSYSVEGENILSECKVSLNNILHHLKRYESQKIRIEINGEEAGRGRVKPILREIINENNLDILKDDTDGKKTQTQKIGREVIEHFIKKGI